MAEIPDAAVQLAAEAIMEAQNANDGEPERFEARLLARAALEAAAPVLLAPLVKRHAPVASEWGGFYCGTCWAKDGNRPVWPCNETLAIGALLPATRPDPDSSPPAGTAGDAPA